MTAEQLLEATAKAIKAVLCENGLDVSSPDECDLDDVERERWEVVQQSARAALAVAIEAAAKAVKQVSDGFLSEEYATPQPVGSIQERFACSQAIDAIRALLPARKLDLD